MSVWKKYGFLWVTGAMFLGSFAAHWYFGWYAYQDSQADLGQTADVSGYLTEMLRDTFENWQSEFLQLMWQVAGLAFLLHVGSPASRDGQDRLEAKVDLLLHKLDHPSDDRPAL